MYLCIVLIVHSMKKLIGLLLVVGILAALFITNPSKEQHNNKMAEALNEKVGNSKEKSSLAHSLGMSIASKLMNNVVEVHNYYLFSLGEMNDKTVTLGILGNVFIINKD